MSAIGLDSKMPNISETVCEIFTKLSWFLGSSLGYPVQNMEGIHPPNRCYADAMSDRIRTVWEIGGRLILLRNARPWLQRCGVLVCWVTVSLLWWCGWPADTSLRELTCGTSSPLECASVECSQRCLVSVVTGTFTLSHSTLSYRYNCHYVSPVLSHVVA